LAEDSVFGVKDSLIADFEKVTDPARAYELGFDGPFWSVDWDFVLAAKKDTAKEK
jgi:catechol 1,2-dioxygenase